MIGSLTPVAEPQVRQGFERRQIDMGPLPSANGRATLPVEHQQRHFEPRTSRPARRQWAIHGLRKKHPLC